MQGKLVAQLIKYTITTIANGAIWAIGYNAVDAIVAKLKEKIKK